MGIKFGGDAPPPQNQRSGSGSGNGGPKSTTWNPNMGFKFS